MYVWMIFFQNSTGFPFKPQYNLSLDFEILYVAWLFQLLGTHLGYKIVLDEVRVTSNNINVWLSWVTYSAIMADDWGVDDTPVVVAPEVQDIKLFGKWSTDDVQVSDISLTVSLSLKFYFTPGF